MMTETQIQNYKNILNKSHQAQAIVLLVIEKNGNTAVTFNADSVQLAFLAKNLDIISTDDLKGLLKRDPIHDHSQQPVIQK